jgi:hypothetical protein
MKLIYEYNEVNGEIEEDLNESTGKSTKTYYITGTFSTIGEKNRNGRTYPRHIWETEVSKYQKEINENTINTLMEYEHPERTFVDPLSAVSKIVKLTVEGNKVNGKAKLLNNPKANQLKNLIDEGIKIGVSSRGVGSVGKDGVVEAFKLITYDCVAQPSDYNANTTGLTEGINKIQNGILMTESFDIVDDKIVRICGKDTCLTESREKINKIILEKIEAILSTNGDGENGADGADADTIANDRLNTEIKKLKISDVITILGKMTGTDKTLTVAKLINTLRNQGDTKRLLDLQVMKKVYNERLSSYTTE